MRKMRDSGVEWIGEIPEGWEVKPLKYSLKSVCGGATPAKAVHEYWNGDIPWVSSKEVKQEHLMDTSLHISQEAVDSCSTQICPAGSLVIVVRSGIIKHTIPVAFLDVPMSINQDIKALGFHETCTARYFMRFVQGLNDQLLVALSHGKATVDNLDVEAFINMPISIPPLAEQERIADYLDARCAAIDADVARRRELVGKLREYRKCVISRAVTRGLDEGVPMRDSGVEWIGEIPEGWEVKPIKANIRISNGSDPKLPGDIPVWGSGAEPFKTCGEFKEGPAVLLGRKGTLDKPQYIEGKYWNVDTAFDAKPYTSRISFRYFYFMVLCIDVGPYATNTAKPSMTQTDWGNFKMPFPPLAEQERIAGYLDARCAAIDDNIAKQEQLISKLGEYRKSIIHAAVTGRIDLS